MRVVVLSDIHSGDTYGLADPANIPKKRSVPHRLAKTLFDWYVGKIQEIGAVDLIISPGELIEGPGSKDTMELWTTDLEEQADACVDLLTMWNCPSYKLCYASLYHSGKDANSEHMVMRGLVERGREADIKTTQRLDIEGLKVSVLHKVGGSATAYGFASQLMKAGAHDAIRGLYRGYERADLYLRGHTHVYGFAGNDMLSVVNCPSLKWPMGRYGRGIDRPYYAMGIVELEINGPNDWDWKAHILRHKLPEEAYAKISA